VPSDDEPDGNFGYKEKYIDGEIKKQNLLEKLFGGSKEGTET